MIEYPAMIYKNGRNKVFTANCIVKNIVGFGKTEEEAINNLKTSLESCCVNITQSAEIIIKPIHGFLKA